MTGWKHARIQRIQNIELAWLGGRVVRFSEISGERRDARTQPLSWFSELACLKTLVVHIEETNRNVIRRQWESDDWKKYQRKKMAGKCQGRMTRALRCCRGMDYITLLRGLHWVRVFDLDKQLRMVPREEATIRDQSFVIDVERAVTQQKSPSKAAKARPERLDALFPVGERGWNPGDEDFQRVCVLFDEDTGYQSRPNDLDTDSAASEGTIDSDSGDSEGDDSDDSGSPPRWPPSRRPDTPAPSVYSGEEEERSGNEGENDHSGSEGDDSGNNSDDSYDTMRRRRLVQYRRRCSTVNSD